MNKVTVLGGRCAPFPLPMLRFAEAWPATDEEAMKIERSVRGEWGSDPGPQEIELYTGQSETAQIMSAKRWASFGWKIKETEEPRQMATGRPRRLAQATKDAYSFPTYGYDAWLRCCALLLRRGYSEREAEAILRSKWTRWAADGASTNKPGAEDLARFLDNPRNACTPSAVQEMVANTFTD